MNNNRNNDLTWEAICRKCGRCCYEKLEDGRGKIIYTQNACEYLDRESKSCSIYDRRFELNPLCVQLTPELAPVLSWLPADCAYRPVPDRFTRKNWRRGRKR